MKAVYHKEQLIDRAAMLAMRAFLAVQPELKSEPDGRPGFDAMMQKTPAAEGVAYEAASVGGVAGWWCRPADCVPNSAVLYFHGGAYILGSAAAYRNFCSQIAARCRTAVFVVDYALAPEKPFPQAFLDAEVVASALIEGGISKLIVAGDSAGGGLALALMLSLVDAEKKKGTSALRAGVVFSPWADLALTGASLVERASQDPLLTREVLDDAARLYLGTHDRFDPQASALYGDFSGFPPLLVHVGEDEVLLDDSRRVAERIHAANRAVELSIWQGMTHVFVSNLALRASQEALDEVGSFVRDHIRN